MRRCSTVTDLEDSLDERIGERHDLNSTYGVVTSSDTVKRVERPSW
jgi:hypothetical protein